MTTHQTSLLQTQFDELLTVAPEGLSFAPSTHVRAFVLQRAHGDLLLYNAPGLAAAQLDVTRQYLNHSHEAMFGPQGVEAPLFVHERDSEATAASMTVAETFAERHRLDDDFEIIPTPGHTPGATAYLWDSGRHRFLFTGDSLYLRDDEWRVAVLDSSDRAAYLESLELLRELEFDVLVPWAATAGRPYVAETGLSEARRRLDAIIKRVRGGASH